MRARRLICSLLVAWPVAAADAPVENAAPAEAAVEVPAPPATRTALIPDEGRRAAELARTLDEETLLLSDGAVAVYRAVVTGTPRGVAMLVMPRGAAPDSANAIAHLRRTLPRRDFATLTFALPDQPDPGTGLQSAAVAAAVRARLDAAHAIARERAAGGHVLVVAEGEAAAWLVWAQRNGLGAESLVAINLDADAPLVDGERPARHLGAVSTPALVLVESPLDWPVDDALGAGTELQRLPAGYPQAERLDRRLRGWLKRRLG